MFGGLESWSCAYNTCWLLWVTVLRLKDERASVKIIENILRTQGKRTCTKDSHFGDLFLNIVFEGWLPARVRLCTPDDNAKMWKVFITPSPSWTTLLPHHLLTSLWQICIASKMIKILVFGCYFSYLEQKVLLQNPVWKCRSLFRECREIIPHKLLVSICGFCQFNILRDLKF